MGCFNDVHVCYCVDVRGLFMDIVEYAEKIMGLELLEYQKTLLRTIADCGVPVYIDMPHRMGRKETLCSIELSRDLMNEKN